MDQLIANDATTHGASRLRRHALDLRGADDPAMFLSEVPLSFSGKAALLVLRLTRRLGSAGQRR